MIPVALVLGLFAAAPTVWSNLGHGVTMFTAGPYPGAQVVLPPEAAARCTTWAIGRDENASRLCWRLIVKPAELPAGRPVTNADLGTPEGFIEAVGLTETDFAVFRKASSVSPFAIVPSERYSDDWFEGTESCAEEPGAIQHDGRWSWCKPDPTMGETDHDMKKFGRKARRLGPVVAGVVAVVGLALLLVVGNRARRRRG